MRGRWCCCPEGAHTYIPHADPRRVDGWSLAPNKGPGAPFWRWLSVGLIASRRPLRGFFDHRSRTWPGPWPSPPLAEGERWALMLRRDPFGPPLVRILGL